MKNKGLIIMTLVMVLVLAVSLTTATYAWFSNEGSAKVTAIDFSVGNSSDIIIGVSATNAYKSTNVSQADFYSGSTSYDANGNSWTGDVNALGTEVNTGLSLAGMDKAVYSATNVTLTGTKTATLDDYTGGQGTAITAGINPDASGHQVIKAAGNSTNGSFDVSSIEAAVKQTDYLDTSFGAVAGKDNVLAYGCLIHIRPTDTAKTTLGLNAAVHVAYSIDGAALTEVDVYGTKGYGDLRSSVAAFSLPTVEIDSVTKSFSSSIVPAAGDGYVWIELAKASNTSTPLGTAAADIKQLRLIIYICGEDEDCVTDGTGVGSTITIEFLSINQTQWAA